MKLSNSPINMDVPLLSHMQQQGAICFGPFILLARQHLLLKDGEPVTLGSRALALLIAMVERAGELLEKTELIAFAWPKMVVEECNLRAQIVALRRALSDDGHFAYIATVPGRGYRFIAPVTQYDSVGDNTAVVEVKSPVKSELPALMTPIIGREEVIRELCEQVISRRFVTLTGPGGIGKTTVALAVANALADEFPQGSCFIDLAPVTAPHLIPGMLASALRLNAMVDDPLRGVISALSSSRLLLVFDNCEPVLESVAGLIEQLLRQAPQCCVLTSSREPLRAAGESVQVLDSLPTPMADSDLNAAQALAYPAIQLFVERVQAHDPSFTLGEADVAAVCAICRKLDSSPLAIEIAAARVRTFGIPNLVNLLDGSFRLLMTGRRTAMPRHRSLAAALDWTYSILSPAEQGMLRQLAVFTGPFTLAAVRAVIHHQEPQDHNALSLLESLMEKSLLSAREDEAVKRYRLLETTRVYALEKLAEHDEAGLAHERHALFTRQLLAEAGQKLNSLSPAAWIALYGPEINAVRSALDWTYGAAEHLLAVEITLVAVPLWLRLGLLNECRSQVERGLEENRDLDHPATRRRMQLMTALATVLMLTYGAGEPVRGAWRQVREDAQILGDTEHKLKALWGLWSDRCAANQYREALELAERYILLAEQERIDDSPLLGKRMLATTLFYMADLAGARQNIDEAINTPCVSHSDVIEAHFDQRIAAYCLKANISLLEGRVDETMFTFDSNVEKALKLNHPATLWYTLCMSTLPIALLTDNLPSAACYLSLLQDSTTQHDLHIWRLFGDCFESILLIRQNQQERGVRQLGEALRLLRLQADGPLFSFFQGEYALGLSAIGLGDVGLEVLEHTLQLTLSRHERWYLPELLRLKARLHLAQGAATASELAHSLLYQARAEATYQGARFWIGRINNDLARLEELRRRRPMTEATGSIVPTLRVTRVR
ncbi:winged helix-turn-helix domain-containing protein [Pseudomonas agarici]|uniref:ATP-binding protein n=1 Tax=Pseudomonas agarici TaxID=46677 RepID=UPI0002D5CFBA|nr:winged helix-turn-helix domain-containing protein [Pseudomonas agarici]NWC08436.1 winged helix-turn-helix domain-containing protein [Pseudomonas agarici]SEK66781.1 transcriptional regulator, LuxR family [Pseudomonas agarici]